MFRNRDATGTAHSFNPIDALRRMSNAFCERFDPETLSGRVTVEESISCYYTETRYGCYGAGRERECLAGWHGGEVLARSSCARHARVDSFDSFYCDVSFMNFFYEASQTRKKKKHSYEYFFLN